jgi:hypothetical protein
VWQNSPENGGAAKNQLRDARNALIERTRNALAPEFRERFAIGSRFSNSLELQSEKANQIKG